MNQSPVQTALVNAPAMTQLLASPGWAIVSEEFTREMSRCTQQVMELIDDPEERAQHILRYRNLKECLEKPTRILEGAKTLIENHREAMDDTV